MKICHLYISSGHNYFGHHGQPPGEHPIIEVERVECVTGRGIRGDRFFDFKKNYKGQVTFFSMDIYRAACKKLSVSNKPPSVFRRNILADEVNLNSLVGIEFEVQGVGFRGMAECTPCHWMDQAFGPGAEKFLVDNGGLRAAILTDGFISVDR